MICNISNYFREFEVFFDGSKAVVIPSGKIENSWLTSP
jgi:hypothetical protein